MKLFLKRLLPFFLALWMILSLAACNDSDTPSDPDEKESGSQDGTDSDALDLFLEIVTKGKSEFKIVYPEDANETMLAAVDEVRNGIESYTGARLSKNDDFLSHSIKESTYEILVGNTNREASQKYFPTLRNSEYVIALEGNKLVICGSDANATKKATNYFIREIVRKKEGLEKGMTDGTLRILESDAYHYEGSYQIKSALIDGVSIDQYRIVVPSQDIDAENYVAAMLAEHISFYTGARLSVVSDAEPRQDCEILIGQTNRTTVTPVAGKYLIEVTDKSLQVVSQTKLGLIDCYWEILDHVIPTNKSQVDLKKGDRFEGTENLPDDVEHSGELRIMFHNVWGYSIADYPVYDRADLMLAAYKTYRPDILGWQEASSNHRNDSRSKNLMAWLKSEYNEICFSGSYGGLGNPIFYRKDAGLTLLDSGYVRARANDKGTTWAVFKTADGTIFGVTNSHYEANTNADNDPAKGDQYRTASAEKMLEAIRDIRNRYQTIPIISGGDFNSNSTSEAYNVLRAGGLTNVRGLFTSPTEFQVTPFSPHHSVTKPDAKGVYSLVTVLNASVAQAIDHIFHSGDAVTLHRYRILDDPFSLTSSDHAPHYVDLTFTK